MSLSLARASEHTVLSRIVALVEEAQAAHAVAGVVLGPALREEAGGWSVILLSGESLRFAATFRVLGMSPRLAAELETSIAAIEADLDETQRAAHDAFAGTLLLVDG